MSAVHVPSNDRADHSDTTEPGQVVRVGIAGIAGRMGGEVLAAARGVPAVLVAGGLDRPERAGVTERVLGGRTRVVGAVAELLPEIDVLIDFTTPAATLAHARACAEAGRAFVGGATGLAPEQLDELRELADRVPILYARNMSIGVQAVMRVLPVLVGALDGYDVEIVEAHHRHKRDAPSGTALALAEAIGAALSAPLADLAVHGRSGEAPRRPGEIGIHAVRGGGNAGEHSVILADDGEEIRITHRVFGRRAFALGALRAARVVVTAPAGFYGMDDVVVAPIPTSKAPPGQTTP